MYFTNTFTPPILMISRTDDICEVLTRINNELSTYTEIDVLFKDDRGTDKKNISITNETIHDTKKYMDTVRNILSWYYDWKSYNLGHKIIMDDQTITCKLHKTTDFAKALYAICGYIKDYPEHTIILSIGDNTKTFKITPGMELFDVISTIKDVYVNNELGIDTKKTPIKAAPHPNIWYYVSSKKDTVVCFKHMAVDPDDIFEVLQYLHTRYPSDLYVYKAGNHDNQIGIPDGATDQTLRGIAAQLLVEQVEKVQNTGTEPQESGKPLILDYTLSGTTHQLKPTKIVLTSGQNSTLLIRNYYEVNIKKYGHTVIFEYHVFKESNDPEKQTSFNQLRNYIQQKFQEELKDAQKNKNEKSLEFLEKIEQCISDGIYTKTFTKDTSEEIKNAFIQMLTDIKKYVDDKTKEHEYEQALHVFNGTSM